MLTGTQRPRPPLVLDISLWVGLTLLANGLIFSLGWDRSTSPPFVVAFEPPGWVVGAVWSAVLFPLMITVRWRLNADTAAVRRARAWATALLIACLVWPFYTLALGSLIGGLSGNVGTLLLTVVAIRMVCSVDRRGAALLVPVALWLIFATLIVVASLGWV
jgi:translocator protein